MIKNYQRKPEFVQAIQFCDTAECITALQEFIGTEVVTVSYATPEEPYVRLKLSPDDDYERSIRIGDFIVKEPDGRIKIVPESQFTTRYEETPNG